MKDTDEDTAQEAEALSGIHNNYTTKDAIHKVSRGRHHSEVWAQEQNNQTQRPQAKYKKRPQIRAKCKTQHLATTEATKVWKGQRQ